MTLKRSDSVSFKRAAWAAFLATVITGASGWQVAPAAPDISWFRVDHWAHFFVFGLLATLVRRSFKNESNQRADVISWGLTALFGLSDELHQATNPVRMFDPSDWVMDAAGAAVALTVWRFWPWYRRTLEWRLGGKLRKPSPEGVPLPAS